MIQSNYYGYVYLALCDDKNYVGQHVGKFSQTYTGSGIKWKKYIKGKQVRVILLDKCFNNIDLNNREKYWISIYKNIPGNLNIINGGQANSIEYRQHMSKTLKKVMSEGDTKQKISKSLKEYRKNNPFSDEHRSKLSNSAKRNNTQSVRVCAIIDGKEIWFNTKHEAIQWWKTNYPPFDREYSDRVYRRLITQSCNTNDFPVHNNRVLNVKWKSYNKSNNSSRSIPVYCEVDGKIYEFKDKLSAAQWWFDNYPFSDTLSVTYTRKITDSINGKQISYKSDPVRTIKACTFKKCQGSTD